MPVLAELAPTAHDPALRPRAKLIPVLEATVVPAVAVESDCLTVQ